MNERMGLVLAPFAEPGGRSHTVNEPLTLQRFEELTSLISVSDPAVADHLQTTVSGWASSSGGRLFFKRVGFPNSADVVIDRTHFHFPLSLKNEPIDGWKVLLAEGNKTVAAVFTRVTSEGAKPLLITTGIDGVKRVNGTVYHGGHLSDIENEGVRRFLTTDRTISLDSEGARTFNGVKYRGLPQIYSKLVQSRIKLTYEIREILHSQREREVLGFSVKDSEGKEYARVEIVFRNGKKMAVVDQNEYEIREGSSVRLYRLSPRLGGLLDGFRAPTRYPIPRYEIPGSLDARALESRRRFPNLITKRDYLDTDANIKPSVGIAESDGRVHLGHTEIEGKTRAIRFYSGQKYEGKWLEICAKTYDKDYGWLFNVYEVDKKTKRRTGESVLVTLRVNPSRAAFMESVVPDTQAFKDFVAGNKNFRGEVIEPRMISRVISRDMFRLGYLNIGKTNLDGMGFNARIYFRAEKAASLVFEGDRIIMTPDFDDRYGQVFKVEVADRISQTRRQLSTYRIVRTEKQLLERFDPVVQTWIDFVLKNENGEGKTLLPKPVRARVLRSQSTLAIGNIGGVRVECSDKRLRRFSKADVVFAEVDQDYGPLFNVFGVNGNGRREPRPLMKIRVNREKQGNLEVIESERRSFLDYVRGGVNTRGIRVKPRPFLATADRSSQPFVFLGRGASGHELGFHLKRDTQPRSKVIVEPVSVNGGYMIDVFSVIRSPLDGKYYKYSLIETYEIVRGTSYGFRVAEKKGALTKAEFTEVEKKIIRLLLEGKTLDEISAALSMLTRRAESLVGSVFSKLGSGLAA